MQIKRISEDEYIVGIGLPVSKYKNFYKLTKQELNMSLLEELDNEEIDKMEIGTEYQAKITFRPFAWESIGNKNIMIQKFMDEE